MMYYWIGFNEICQGTQQNEEILSDINSLFKNKGWEMFDISVSIKDSPCKK
jgi:hypothetical protein